ncbi:coiled-coil domain-containing protein 58-like [Mizuhopecten yessoensis]|uniref:Protein MIX23 n=1 Tax=Mizuhopecten yessoensis TaxID=6573 RepID=A0A210QQD3_MIZYE|nr:coiled-coil domain-containing protein 58-like [Mizuhopecten yessoensis]OWF50940.1 Coiled-coil domain-containing protein 58 [Mizuhopecten yessoensis]
MAASMNKECDCSDFMKFQECLKTMRTVDDRIIHGLNTAIPTKLFASKVDVTETCKGLYEEIIQSHQARERAIRKCVTESGDIVMELSKQRDNDMDNIELLKDLRTAQTKLRLMKSEFYVDEIVNDRTFKAFYERCGTALKFPNKPRL